MVTLEDIKQIYMNSNVCLAETLADIPVDNGSLEEAHELYMKAMNKIEDDHFFRLAEGEVEVLIGDNAIHKSNALNDCGIGGVVQVINPQSTQTLMLKLLARKEMMIIFLQTASMSMSILTRMMSGQSVPRY